MAEMKGQRGCILRGKAKERGGPGLGFARGRGSHLGLLRGLSYLRLGLGWSAEGWSVVVVADAVEGFFGEAEEGGDLGYGDGLEEAGRLG